MKEPSFATVEEAAAAFALGRPAFRCAACGRVHRPRADGRYRVARCVELMLSRACASFDPPQGPRTLRTSRRVADYCASPAIPFWFGPVGDRMWDLLRCMGEAVWVSSAELRWLQLTADLLAFLALERPVFRTVTAGWRDRLFEPARRQRIVELASSLSAFFPPEPGPVGVFFRAMSDGTAVVFPDGQKKFRPGWPLSVSDVFLGKRAPRVGVYGRKRVAWVWRGERVLVALAGDVLVFSWGLAALAIMPCLEPEEVAAIAGPPSDARFWKEVLP